LANQLLDQEYQFITYPTWQHTTAPRLVTGEWFLSDDADMLEQAAGLVVSVFFGGIRRVQAMASFDKEI